MVTPDGKKKKAPDQRRAGLASNGPRNPGGALGTTKAILDRFHRIGAQYVRRTETLGFTLLLEVGTPTPTGVQFISLLEAEKRLLALGPKAPKQASQQVPKVHPAPSTEKPAPVLSTSSNPYAPLSEVKGSWADEPEDLEVVQASVAVTKSQAIQTRPNGKGKAKPSPKPQVSPRAAAKAKPSPHPVVLDSSSKRTGFGQDWTQRAPIRLGMTAEQVKALPKEKRTRAEVVLSMTQREFAAFRASGTPLFPEEKAKPSLPAREGLVRRDLGDGKEHGSVPGHGEFVGSNLDPDTGFPKGTTQVQRERFLQGPKAQALKKEGEVRSASL